MCPSVSLKGPNERAERDTEESKHTDQNISRVCQNISCLYTKTERERERETERERERVSQKLLNMYRQVHIQHVAVSVWRPQCLGKLFPFSTLQAVVGPVIQDFVVCSAEALPQQLTHGAAGQDLILSRVQKEYLRGF